MKLKHFCRAAAVWAAALFTAVPAFGGEVLLTPEEESFIEVQTERRTGGPALIFSDSPEMVYDKGVLYRDTVQGSVRLFFHHVNALNAGSKKLAVLLQNKDSLRPVNYKVTRLGLGSSSYNYLQEGKECQQHYFDDTYQKKLPLPAGRLGFARSAELLTGRGFLLRADKLLTGTLDFFTDRPLQLSILLCEPQNALDLYSDTARVLPMDEHPLRGTFANADWEYNVKEPLRFAGGEQYSLCLASAGEGFAKGVDATTGAFAENYGNYGVMYKVNFTVDSQRPVRFLFNPLGGEFAGWGVLEDAQGRRTLLALPPGRLALGRTIEETIELARLKNGRYSFIWSPPGAGNLPVRLLWKDSEPMTMREKTEAILGKNK